MGFSLPPTNRRVDQSPAPPSGAILSPTSGVHGLRPRSRMTGEGLWPFGVIHMRRSMGPRTQREGRRIHDPRLDSFAACARTLAIRPVWPGPAVGETAVAEDASAKVGVEPGQSTGGPSLLDCDVIVGLSLGHLIRRQEEAAVGPSVASLGGLWADQFDRDRRSADPPLVWTGSVL